MKQGSKKERHKIMSLTVLHFFNEVVGMHLSVWLESAVYDFGGKNSKK